MKRLLKSKKGYEWWQIVIAITALVSLGIYSVIYAGIFSSTGDISGDITCRMSSVANCYGKTPIVGTETFKVNCPMDMITITMDDLEKGMPAARREIKELNKRAEKEGFRGYDYFEADDKHKLKEWVLDNYMASYLKTGWANLGAGEIDCLFSNWWWFFGCEKEEIGDIRDCNGFVERITPWNWRTYNPPRFCQPMARIKFDQEIQNEFKSEEITSLTEWMKKNPLPLQETSYYEFLISDAELRESALYTRNYDFRTDEPLAIVYTRINVHMLDKAFVAAGGTAEWSIEKITGWDPKIFEQREHFDAMMIIPYSKLDEYCVV